MGFWRTEDPVLRHNSDGTTTVLKGGMFPHQRRVWESEAYIKALVGGYGSGKSITTIKRGIALCLANGGIPGMIVSPSYDVARKTIIQDMKRLLDGRKIKYEYKVQAKEFQIKYKNINGIIWIGSGDRPDSLKGPNLAWAAIDEPFIQDRDVFLQMMARVRHGSAKHREILLTGTPEQLNWGYDILAGDEAENFDTELIQASSRDNLVNPKVYLESLEKGYDSKMREAYINGEFVDLSSSRIYYGFSRDGNVSDFSYPGEIELRVGMDFNVNPMSATIFYVEGSKVFVLDEIKISDSNTEGMAIAVRKKIEQYNPLQKDTFIKVYPDPTGRARKTSAPVGVTDHTILASKKFTVYSASGIVSQRDSYNACNAKLERAEIIVHPRCKSLIKDYQRLTYEKTKAQLEKQGLTHMSDSLKYAIHYLFPIQIELPRGKFWVDV